MERALMHAREGTCARYGTRCRQRASSCAVDGIVDALDSTNVELAGVSVELRKVPAPVNVPGALGRRTSVRGHEARRARVLAENLGRGRENVPKLLHQLTNMY
jgi:hypothetical protein